MPSFSSHLLDLILPPTCGLCGVFGESSPCPACRNELVAADAPLPTLRPEIAAALAVHPFRGRAGEAVRALKFARRTDLAHWMAEEMREALLRSGFAPDVVVPVPIHWRRRALRGFNQSELLCADLTLPRAELALKRLRHTRAQSSLDPARRAKNLAGAFVATGVAGKRVLLVDDVVTSGHTARECARALLGVGAKEVLLLAFAFGSA